MKILHFYKNSLPFFIGGVEQFIDQLARTTELMGIENKVLSLSNNQIMHSQDYNGYKIFTANRDFTISSNSMSFESVNIFKKLALNSDLIHIHHPWPFADIAYKIALSRIPKIPTVVTYHSDIIKQNFLLHVYRPLQHHFLHSVDEIVATSPNYLLSSNVLQSFKDKVSVIPIGIDESTYISDPSIVNYYKNQFGDNFFLFLGAFRYYKGLEFLIEAAKFVDYPIVIAGDSSFNKALREKIKILNLKNVYLIGPVCEKFKASLIEACFSLILPSNLRSEAFGITLLEGAMFSKPLISCEISTGTSYVNIHLETGLVVPPSNPGALAHAMTWLSTHKSKANEMGSMAYERYKQLFTAEKMSKSYISLYKKLLSK